MHCRRWCSQTRDNWSDGCAGAATSTRKVYGQLCFVNDYKLYNPLEDYLRDVKVETSIGPHLFSSASGTNCRPWARRRDSSLAGGCRRRCDRSWYLTGWGFKLLRLVALVDRSGTEDPLRKLPDVPHSMGETSGSFDRRAADLDFCSASRWKR